MGGPARGGPAWGGPALLGWGGGGPPPPPPPSPQNALCPAPQEDKILRKGVQQLKGRGGGGSGGEGAAAGWSATTRLPQPTPLPRTDAAAPPAAPAVARGKPGPKELLRLAKRAKKTQEEEEEEEEEAEEEEEEGIDNEEEAPRRSASSSASSELRWKVPPGGSLLLESVYSREPYPSAPTRASLAEQLQTTPRRVSTWFQSESLRGEESPPLAPTHSSPAPRRQALARRPVGTQAAPGALRAEQGGGGGGGGGERRRRGPARDPQAGGFRGVGGGAGGSACSTPAAYQRDGSRDQWIDQ